MSVSVLCLCTGTKVLKKCYSISADPRLSDSFQEGSNKPPYVTERMSELSLRQNFYSFFTKTLSLLLASTSCVVFVSGGFW